MPYDDFPFPPIERECNFVARLYAYFDESGKHGDHPIVAFSGFIDGMQGWQDFQRTWDKLLRENQIPEFHTSKAIRYSRPFGIMKPGKPEDRAKDLLPFVKAITEGLELGISFAVDVNAFKSPRFQPLRESFGGDPHYFAFFISINAILSYYGIPKDFTVSLILDDEEEKAHECYRLLKKMKLANEEIRKRIVSICFSDDRQAAPLQASDLFAYITRKEALRRFAGKEYPYRVLHSAFSDVSKETGNHLHFVSGFYDAEEIAKYQEWHIQQIM